MHNNPLYRCNGDGFGVDCYVRKYFSCSKYTIHICDVKNKFVKILFNIFIDQYKKPGNIIPRFQV